MINTLTNPSAEMNEIRIEKTVRRKLAEIALYFWGLFGGVACLLMAHQAVQLDLLARVTQVPSSSAVPMVVMYTFVWIGGSVFLGFFALLAPVRMGLIASQSHMPANRESLEQGTRSNFRGRVLLMPDDKGPKVAAG